MDIYNWLRTLLFFIKIDLKSIPSRFSIKISQFNLWYRKLKYRKIYEESNLIFFLIFFPSIIYRRLKDRRTASVLGVTLDQLYEKRMGRITEETEFTAQEVQKIKAKNMRLLADIIPGATIHLYNVLEKMPFYSLRFVLSELQRIFE